MAFLALEDFTGSIEVIVFPKTLSKLDAVIAEGKIIAVHGRLDIRDDENPKIILESAAPFGADIESLIISLPGEKIALLDKIRPVIGAHRGEIPIIISCDYGNISVNNAGNCDGSGELIGEIDKICGKKQCRIKKTVAIGRKIVYYNRVLNCERKRCYVDICLYGKEQGESRASEERD